MKHVIKAFEYGIVWIALYMAISVIYMILAHNIDSLGYWEHDIFNMIEWLAG
jgi:hypothetical protein